MWRGVFLFFFQAEDGIRDLVRSRGLGDVYKRQAIGTHRQTVGLCCGDLNNAQTRVGNRFRGRTETPVSYTHLTLPTSDLV